MCIGCEVVIIVVSVCSKVKDCGVDLLVYGWELDFVVLVCCDDVDIFVELMGGDNGLVKVVIEVVIVVGKDVVIVNKVMLVYYGQDLVFVVEVLGSVIWFEVVVVGGIFVIKVLNEGLVVNCVSCVMGVMNGICNYILIWMENVGLIY